MKSYTDLEQSKKLAEILLIESADMYYCYGMDIYTKVWSFDDTPTIIDNSNQIDIDFDIPCWSLAALLEIIRNNGRYELQMYEGGYYFESGEFMTESYFNPVDACYEMILKLHELKML